MPEPGKTITIRRQTIMERTLNIDGRDITFKASAAFPLTYRAYFGRDFFADMDKLTEEDDRLIFYDVVWVLAKGADPSIPTTIEWFDSFESFPIFETYYQLNDMILKSFATIKN